MLTILAANENAHQSCAFKAQWLAIKPDCLHTPHSDMLRAMGLVRLIAAILSMSVCLGMLGLALIGGQRLYVQTTRAALWTAFENNDPEAISSTFKAAVNLPAWLRTTKRQDAADDILTVCDATCMIRLAEQNKDQTFEAEDIEHLLQSAPDDFPRSPLRALKADLALLSEAQTRVDAGDEQRSLLDSRYKLLYDTVCEIFTLQPGEEPDTVFYNSGMLKNLPVVPGIPDDINSATQLRDALAEAEGSVSNEHLGNSSLLTRLSDLQHQGAQIQADYSNLVQRNGEMSGEIEILQSKIEKSSTQLIKALKTAVLLKSSAE